MLKDRNLRIVFTVTLMAVLGVSSLTPLFPRLMKEFDVPSEKVILLITVFTFPGVFLGPLLGVVADRMGRKKVLIPSLLIFATAGTTCAFVSNFNILLVLRFFQGTGAGMLGVLGTTIIGDLFEGRERVTAMGLNASVLSMATATYPAIGGALGSINWRLPFLLPALAFPVAMWVLFGLETIEPDNSQALGGYLKNTFASVFTLKLSVIFSLGLLTFVMLFGPILSYFPIWMSDRWSASPVLIGVLLSLSSLSSAAAASQLGKVRGKVSQRKLLMLAFGGYAFIFLVLPHTPHLYLIIIPMILFGVVQGFNIPSLLTLVAGAAPVQYRGAVMAMNSTVFRLGQTIGPPLAALAFTGFGLNGMYSLAGIVAILAVLGLSFMGNLLEKQDF